MWSENRRPTLSVGFLCKYRKREVTERVGSLISPGKGVGRGQPPAMPAQFRIANCSCFLGLHAQTPPLGVSLSLLSKFRRRGERSRSSGALPSRFSNRRHSGYPPVFLNSLFKVHSALFLSHSLHCLPFFYFLPCCP